MEISQDETLQIFHDSLERCGPAERFLGRFYELFLASSPAVARKFSNTDFRAQVRALKTSFYLAMLASDRQSEAQQYLDRIAARHSRADLDISPEYYDCWMDSLVAAVREFDPQFDAGVERAWRRFMQPAIDYMKSRY